jgi:hypothetical protein
LTVTSELYNFLEQIKFLLENTGELYNFLEKREILLENTGELYNFADDRDFTPKSLAKLSRVGLKEMTFYSIKL